MKKKTPGFLLLWDNGKNRAGNWLAITTGKSLVWFQWFVKFHNNGQWFIFITTPIFGVYKNNANFGIQLCFGKYYIQLLYHW